MIATWEDDQDLFVDPQHYTRTVVTTNPQLLRVYDTTLRDGEQMPGVAMSPEQKLIIAKELSKLGCHIIDLGFPASAPTERKALQLILESKYKGELRDDVEILVMCRSTPLDIDMTVSTIQEIGFAPSDVTFLIFTSASNLHCKYKLGAMLMKREGRNPSDLRDTPLSFFHEANKRMIADAIRYARTKGVSKIEFGTEDASRTPLNQLVDLVSTALDAGAMRYIFPDTTGSLTPEATKFYCSALSATFPQIERVSHFHNDFDLSTINVVTGILNGFTTFSTTINGIGERAGNAPLHSVVTTLRYLYGLEIPGFQYDRLCHVKVVVEEITGVPVQAHEPIIGSNAFTHESGIHICGLAASRKTYEPFPPEDVGARSRLVYGKHSGTRSVVRFLMDHADEIGTVIDDHFVRLVVSEIKHLRELATYKDYPVAFVQQYYTNLARLGISQDEVLELAKRIAASSKQKHRVAANIQAPAV